MSTEIVVGNREEVLTALATVLRDVGCRIRFTPAELLKMAGLQGAADGVSDKEVCICAAIRCDDGTIIRGHRHDSCILTAQRMGKGYTRQDMQGFITSRNRYVDRREGAALQQEAGILSAQTGHPVHPPLFSEDLY